MRISDVIAGKGGGGVLTVAPEASVRELLAVLAEHNIGALVVSTNGSSVDGIVSERDVVRSLHADEAVLDSTVSQIMSTEVRSCAGADTVDEVMALMTQRRIRHVPVTRAGALTGIVSIGDVVKSRMGELEFESDQLDSYVQGSQR